MATHAKVSAPGKVIIHGEHAVVYGREALASCIDKRTECTIRKLMNSDVVCLKVWSGENLVNWTYKKSFLQQLKQECRTDAKTPSPLSSHQLHSLQESKNIDKIDQLLLFIWIGLYLSIASDSTFKSDQGLSMEIKTELPLGAGVGSSASVSVCIAAALLMICGFIDPIVTISKEEKRLHRSFSEQNLKLINAWSYEAEKIVHGNPSGVDNSIITYGGALSYKEGEISFLNSFPPVEILLVSSGVSRSTLDVVNGVRERYNMLPEVYDALFDAIQILTEKAKFNFSLLDQALKEQKSVVHCDEIYNKLITLVDINQNLLRAIEVSHESIEVILDILKRFGLKGKLTGAGAGGCVFAIIKPAIGRSILDDVIDQLRKSGFHSWLVCIGCQGVRNEPVSH